MFRCVHCGKMISFVQRKGQKSVPVEPGAEYFIPDELTGSTIFVNESGLVRKGHTASDGVKGYKLHQCVKRNRR